jgi:YihY family inner membrane protein
VNVLRWLDRLQRRVPALAYPAAVFMKFAEDGAARLAALIAYYAFVSVFPLTLVFVTVLGFLLPGDPSLREDVLHGALAHIPVVGEQLRLHGMVLGVSLAVTLWGARGVAAALQHALNSVWNVPISERPGILAELGRGLALLGTLGLSVLLTGFLSIAGGLVHSTTLRVAAWLVSALVSVATYVAAFRLALARRVASRDLIRGAVAAALVWQGMLATGQLLVSHVVNHAQSLYGAFGLVLGLLAWLHVLATLTLLAAEWDVVRARRLWPRALVVPPLTGADRKAYTDYAVTQRRLPPEQQEVRVRFLSRAKRDRGGVVPAAGPASGGGIPGAPSAAAPPAPATPRAAAGSPPR